jgi:hypothetical protein
MGVKRCPVSRITTPLARKRSFPWCSKKSRLTESRQGNSKFSNLTKLQHCYPIAYFPHHTRVSRRIAEKLLCSSSGCKQQITNRITRYLPWCPLLINLFQKLKIDLKIKSHQFSEMYQRHSVQVQDKILGVSKMWQIDWLIYGFTSRTRIFHLYGDVTIAGEVLQNLGLSSALRAFEQGGIFIVPHLLWHGTSVFPVSSEGPPHSVASSDTRGDVEDLF